MLKKHLILFGIVLAVLLLVVSTFYYPGGSQHDATATGFKWQHNYLCNLVSDKAVNGEANAARPWALVGLLVLCATVGLFFVRFSQRIPDKSASKVIKYAGAGAMIAAVFMATSYHDEAVMVSGTFLPLALFYIAVFVFMSNLLWLKVLSVVCLAVLYATSYVYYTQHYLEWLPILQKVSLALNLYWILALDYLSKTSGFCSIFYKKAAE